MAREQESTQTLDVFFEPFGDGYNVYCRSVEVSVSHGKTREEALASAPAAIKHRLQVSEKEGIRIPEGQWVRIYGEEPKLSPEMLVGEARDHLKRSLVFVKDNVGKIPPRLLIEFVLTALEMSAKILAKTKHPVAKPVGTAILNIAKVLRTSLKSYSLG